MLFRFKFMAVFVATFLTYAFVFAQAPKVDLPKSLPIEQRLLGDNASSCAAFEELKTNYYKDNRYSQLFDYLSSLKDKKGAVEPCIAYYKALCRYDQLKYLEEKQSWDEYFSQGNTYRDQIIENANKAIAKSSSGQYLNLKSQLLLWQFHRDQQDTFAEQSLNDLMAGINSSAKTINDPKPIKEVADKLAAYGEKLKAKEVYKIYVEKIVSSGANDAQLKDIASGFYKDGNLELSESVYDTYIERISKIWPKDKLIPELLAIVPDFAYKSQGPSDMLYAEKIFKRIDDLGAKDVFNQELIYLRAFNLEKAKNYKAAADFYVQLAKDYPQSTHYEEALYKLGLINLYVLGDVTMAVSYFDKLIAREAVSSYVVSSLYQEGLLLQWQGDNQKSRELYNKLLDKAADKYSETVALTRQRLKEIDEAKPLEYNLKMFLDLSLKPESKGLPSASKAELNSTNYLLEKDQKTTVSSLANLPQTGCLQVELQYLWSGNTGAVNPTTMQGDFQTSYSEAGTKEINLIVVTPTGVVDRNFDLLDVR